jgi:anthranilate synthase component I
VTSPDGRPAPTVPADAGRSRRPWDAAVTLIEPNLSETDFLRLAADYPVVPIALEVLGDRETAVGLYEKLAGAGDGFLLESVEGGDRWGRWSFVGWDPAFTVTSVAGSSRADDGSHLPEGDPLSMLEALIDRYRTPEPEALGLDDAPPLHTGAVGYLAYDAVRYVEHLPNRPEDDRGLPEMVWQFVGAIAAADRFRDRIVLMRNVFIGDDPRAQYRLAVDALAADVARIGTPRGYEVRSEPSFLDRPVAKASMSREEFEAAVATAVDHIRAGDAFQIVPSLRFDVDFDGDAFAVYRALRLINPSPFMFFVRSGSLAIAGSSPELMSRVRDGTVFSRPIAGTIPRGATPEADAAAEVHLLSDPKERAEHVMLVDLARNDLGRVCEYGSVAVDELMVVERYSHVMHIVSGVSGRLRPGVGPVDVLRATFPHGTVSGAPKVRAMEIIDELEPTARGPYAGAVGYVDFSGNLDTAIALRTMVCDGTSAWVQAGAGVVADSVPAKEYDECVSKAAAVLAAIQAAPSLR